MDSTKCNYYKKVSNAIKTAIIFVFVDKIYFLPAHLHCKCNLNNLEWYSIKQEGTTSCEQFSLKITNESCYKGLKYCKFMQKKR